MPTPRKSKSSKKSEKKSKQTSTTGSTESKKTTTDEIPNIPTLDDIEREIDEARQTDEADPQKVKKGRPRGSKTKKKEEETEVPEFVVTDESAKGLLRFVSKLLSSRLGDKWEMSSEEIETGSVAVSGMLIKYGKAFADYGVEAAFIMWVFGYAGTRINLKKPAVKGEISKGGTKIELKDLDQPIEK